MKSETVKGWLGALEVRHVVLAVTIGGTLLGGLNWLNSFKLEFSAFIASQTQVNKGFTEAIQRLNDDAKYDRSERKAEDDKLSARIHDLEVKK